MFKFLQAIGGGIAYGTNSEATGALYIRGILKKSGRDADRIPESFYRELAAYAYKFSQSMSQLSSKEKPVNYFVEHLEFISFLLERALEGEEVDAPSPIVEIFRNYNLRAKNIST